jgi:hypothetical protein
MNTVDIQRLFKTPLIVTPTIFDYRVNLSELIPESLSDLMIDEKFKDILCNMDIYITNTEKAKHYPFMLIEVQRSALNYACSEVGPDSYLRYDLYRYLVGLPFYITLDDNRKLPTVDHINRDPRDDRLSNLRYCSNFQNQWNACNPTSIGFHNVTKFGAMNIYNDPLCIVEIIRLWVMLLNTAYEDAELREFECGVDFLNPKGCKSGLIKQFEDMFPVFNRFVFEMIEFIIPSFTTHGYKEDEKHMITKTKIKDMVSLDALMCKTMFDKYPSEEIKVQQNCSRPHLSALGVDIFKFLTHGSFAHLNFLKRLIKLLRLPPTTHQH